MNCSIRLVGDTLRSHQWRVQICRHKPWLTPANQLKRKRWACQYALKAVEWWRNKVYTDEVYLSIGSMPQRLTIRRKLGAAFEDRNLVPTFKGDFDTIQFFAGFSSTGHTQFVPIPQ
jgi:hypothetical protein